MEGGGGAALQPDEIGGAGGSDDSFRPPAEKKLACPWLPQVLPGDWQHTKNCGPTSLLMAAGCYANTAPSKDDIVNLIVWMESHVSGYSADAPQYNGSYTNTSQLTSVALQYFALAATRRVGTPLSELWDAIRSNNPVIVAVSTQAGNDYPSTVMATGGAQHFMLLVGMTPADVILDDPGRGSDLQGKERHFTIDSFLRVWRSYNGASIFFNSSTPPASACTFTDAALEAAVRTALGVPSGSISASQAASLTSLAASGHGIASLAGIECLTSLKDLVLESNAIADLSPLAGIPELGYADLQSNHVAAIPTLKTVDTVSLSNNQISDISGVASMTHLNTLNLNMNQVAHGLSALDSSGLHKDSTIFIQNNPIDCAGEATYLQALRDRGVVVSAACPGF